MIDAIWLVSINLKWDKCVSVNRVINLIFVKSKCFSERMILATLQKLNTKTAGGPVWMLLRTLTKAESKTLTHRFNHGYLYRRSAQNSGNTPPCELAVAPCEISNQPICVWSAQQEYHLRQSKWRWQHLPLVETLQSVIICYLYLLLHRQYRGNIKIKNNWQHV